MNELELFSAALAIHDPAERAAFLDRMCNAPALRRRLDELLAGHARSASPLDRPPVEPAGFAPTGEFATRSFAPATAADHTPAASVGAVVAGRYKLLEPIGEGGMGAVWVADQLDPIKRRVALKLIKPGMDSRNVLARFEAERQALALMDHPNIAQVLDAGTTEDGRPFFVMELVKGTPVTEFCDARKLNPKERLELFVPVCQAIQHAHHKGIIHRDIKPGNVLVELHDEKPVPKVIDFGVAKAVGQQLTERTLYTGFGALVGTPAYMAPEQATFNALDVDTRADVYALGVLLYELLAGSPPVEPEKLKRAALDEMLRLVREEEPQRPSARLSTSRSKASIAATRQCDPAKLSSLMRGELDWIVMKALEKDRARRYDTPNGFAADVQRYLAGEPVQAVPPSALYRANKFLKRHKGPVAVALVVFVALLTGVIATAHQASRARLAESDAWESARAEQKRRAEAEAAEAEAQTQWQRADRERGEKLAALNRAERLLYFSQMTQAFAAARDLRTTLLTRILADTRPAPGRPDQRGWEWHHLDRLTHSWDTETPLDLKAVPGLEERVRTQLPNSDDESTLFHYTADGSRLLVPPLRQDLSKSAGEAPARHRLGSAPGAVFDTATGKLVREIPVPTQKPLDPRDVSFSPDGLFMAFPEKLPAGTYVVRVIELATGRDVPHPLPPTVYSPDVVVAPGAKRVVVYHSIVLSSSPRTAAEGDETLYVWDRGAAAARSLVVQGLTDTKNGVQCRTLPSPDGATAAVHRPPGRRNDAGAARVVEFWDLTANPPVRRSSTTVGTGGTGGTGGMRFSANGKLLGVVNGGRSVRMLDVGTGETLYVWATQVGGAADEGEGLAKSDILGPVLSDDGQRLFLRERDAAVGVVERLSGPRGPGQRSSDRAFVLRGPVRTDDNLTRPAGAIWIAPEGSRLITAMTGAIRSWNLQRHPEYAATWPAFFHQERFFRVATDTQGRYVVALSSKGLGGNDAQEAGAVVAVYVPHIGQIRNTLEIPADVPHAEVAPDGRRLLLGTRPAQVPGAELPPLTWSLHALEDPARNPEVARFVASQPRGDGRFGGGDFGGPPKDKQPGAAPRLRNWTATEVPTFTPDGRWLIEPALATASAGGGQARQSQIVGFNLRRASDGGIENEIRYPEGERVLGAPSSSPDGGRIAVVTSTGPHLRLHCYAGTGGKLLWHREVSAAPAACSPARFSPDGRQVAVARKTHDGVLSVQVFDAATGTTARSASANGAPVRLGRPTGTQLELAFGAGDGLPVGGLNADVPFLELELAFGAGDGLAVADWRQAVVWDGDHSPSRLVGHSGSVAQVLFSADGKRLFTLDLGTNVNFDRSVRVWDTGTGREVAMFRVPSGRPVSFGNRMMSGMTNSKDMWLEGDRVCVRVADGVRVFDGTPRESKKP